METTMIVLGLLMLVISIIQSNSIKSLKKENDELIKYIENQHKENEPMLDYCLRTILHNAIKREDYIEAARCRNAIDKLKEFKK